MWTSHGNVELDIMRTIVILCKEQYFKKITNILILPDFKHSRVANVVFFLMGDSTASEFYMPTFRNTLSVPSSEVVCSQTYEDGTVFRNVGT